MRRALLLLLCGGCAQIFGLDETSKPSTTPDTPAVDAKPDGPPIDARLCTGGTAAMTDPSTGHCYVFFSAPTIRNTARQMCLTIDPTAKLASVESAAENTLIANLIGTTDSFLGGNDEVTEMQFKWDDGTPFVLTNWNTGEPNNALGMFEEDCIVMIGTVPGKWDDRPCATGIGPAGTGAYAFVCERP
jgi:hypothetical protein